MSNSRIPLLQMRVEIPGEQIAAAIALRQDEMHEALQEGVRRAVTGAAEFVTAEAQAAATKAISDRITAYFNYGEGRTAIEAAVFPVLAKLTAQMLKPPAKAKR